MVIKYLRYIMGGHMRINIPVVKAATRAKKILVEVVPPEWSEFIYQ